MARRTVGGVGRLSPTAFGLGRGETEFSGRSPSTYSEPVDRMPESGELITAFSPQQGRRFRMIYSHQLQADPLPPAAGVEGPMAGPLGPQRLGAGTTPRQRTGSFPHSPPSS
jgi:hypothetical protein